MIGSLKKKNFLFRTSLAPILEQEVLSRFRSKMATGTFQAWINTDRMYLSNIFLKLLRHTTLPLEAKKDWWRQLPGSHGKSSQIWYILVVENGPSKFQHPALNPLKPPTSGSTRRSQSKASRILRWQRKWPRWHLILPRRLPAWRDMDCLPGNIEKAMEIHGFP